MVWQLWSCCRLRGRATRYVLQPLVCALIFAFLMSPLAFVHEIHNRFCALNGPFPQVLLRPRHVSMDNLIAAAAIYNSLYSLPDDQGGGVCATFQIVSLSGWVRCLPRDLLLFFCIEIRLIRCRMQASRRPKRAAVLV
jgi:hypothetical protein